jgi:hypothetical protein
MNYDRTSSLCAELAPLPCAVGSLSEPLDDVGCDITDAYELAWVSLSPALTQAGFTPPTPGSPASLSFQMIELAHRSCTPSFSHNEGNSGAFAEWQKGFAR